MDPKEQLRAFLEQRRDLGESEFVLDTMTVDEAMRLLGATPPRQQPAQPGGRVPTGPTRSVPGSASEGTTDWRAALSASGAGPGAGPNTGVARPSRGEGTPAGAGPPPRSQDTPVPPDLRHHSVPDRTIPSPSVPTRPPVVDPTSGSSPDTPIDLATVPTGLVVGTAGQEMFGEPSPCHSLDDIARAVASCSLCSLAATATNPVPGAGNPNADFVCVGEAPGANEDEQGVPFVGAAGQLLTKILAAINLSRDDVFICNVLKHRPPGNRNPTPDEVAACSPYLVRQIQLLKPKVLLALGTFAAQTLLQTKEPIGKLRGKIHRYHGVPLIVTYHPAALLRNPAWKRPTWEDVQLARKLFDRAAGA